LARKKGPQAEEAFQYIRDKILRYELPPGAPVSDNQLAGELAMSRAPVREAMLLLVGEGLLVQGTGGTRVAPISEEDIIEICQVRRAVEVAAVGLIFERGGLTELQKAELKQIGQELDSTDLKEAFMENCRLDDRLHAAIVRFAGNRRLTAISERMRLQIHRARWLTAVLPERWEKAAGEHARIVASLLADDQRRSEEELRNHLLNSEENFKRVLALPQLPSIWGGMQQLKKP
jgi:DNA-binding GntR family transcriptional regulator